MTFLDRISSGWKAWVLLFVITFGAAAPGVFNLPALDRDESRFAQASKQMLESGDYIRLRYQDELRNKKPAGIHWLQAGSTALFTGAEAKQIWTYRVPSWLLVRHAADRAARKFCRCCPVRYDAAAHQRGAHLQDGWHARLPDHAQYRRARPPLYAG